VDVNEHLCG
jgi:hypothetical protein